MIHHVAALVNASWNVARSYRLRLVMSMASLCVSVVPIYFVANALQDTMSHRIAGEGSQYFAFMVVGMATFLMIPVAVNSLANAVGSGINTGILETLLGTRARVPALLLGMAGFDLLWSGLRALVMLVGATALGAAILWSHFAVAAAIVALIVLSYIPFGVIAAALIVVFRTAGPLPQGVMVLSVLLGGVYYPTHVIPAWLQSISGFVPLTYGLRALRATLLEGASAATVLPDVARLLLLTLLLMSVAALSMHYALRYARRSGTLSQY